MIGQHNGIHRYTIGQRRGIGIADERPLYVLSLEPESKRITVGAQEDLLRASFIAGGVNWISLDGPTEPVKAEVRIRYRHEAAAAIITPLGDGRAKVDFEVSQRAITPGQATVFYRNDEVLGGGWILKHQRH